MAGGITFEAAKSILCTVVANGVAPDNPRVLSRTNEAIKSILDEVIPVGGMITADVVASGTNGDELFLPKEFEAAYEVEVIGGSVNGQTDVKQGFYTIVNQFAYVDPSTQHDNPIVDLFLQPDTGDPTILRRKYQYPGLTPNATVRVTGPKRFIPITQDSDYLIVQNILALKDEINSIEMRENRNNPEQAVIYHKNAIDRIQAEVKKHLLDPTNSLKRKANYDDDLENYPIGTFGWMRAMMAFEIPNGLAMGKSELTRTLEIAERKCITRGQYVGTLQEYEATVHGGKILTPINVQTVVAIDLCGYSIDVKNLYYEYMKSGTGKTCGAGFFVDGGEIQFPNGDRRRQYTLKTSVDDDQCITFIGKLRWVKKAPEDFMTIKNFEALRHMVKSVLTGDPNDDMLAIRELDKELSEYTAGQARTFNVDYGMELNRSGLGFGWYGGVL